jgi:hypothetical protein
MGLLKNVEKNFIFFSILLSLLKGFRRPFDVVSSNLLLLNLLLINIDHFHLKNSVSQKLCIGFTILEKLKKRSKVLDLTKFYYSLL